MPQNRSHKIPEIIAIGRKSTLIEFTETVFRNFIALVETLDKASLSTKLIALLLFLIFNLTIGTVIVVWLVVHR